MATNKQNDRQNWLNASETEALIYINFSSQTLRFSAATEERGFEGEILMSTAPRCYKKTEILAFCEDLGIKKIIFLNRDEIRVPPVQKKDYKALLGTYKDTGSKQLIFLLKLTASAEVLKQLKKQHVIALVKFGGMKMRVYQQDFDGTKYIPLFSSSDELNYFMDSDLYQEDEAKEYAPLALRMQRVVSHVKKDVGIFINPCTVVNCDRPLDLRLNYKFIENHLK